MPIYSTKESQICDWEKEFYRDVNGVIANRVTPFYNAFCLISAAVFGYFVCIVQKSCYSKDQLVFGSPKVSDVEDVTQ